MVNGQRTSENNDQLLISLNSPYKNVVEISGFDYSAKGETDSLYYQKDFRWSTDGVLYNDWRPLDNEHLQMVITDPEKDFWPQYRFTQVGSGELEFESISLEITTDDGRISDIPMCGISDNGTCCGQQNLVFECCGGGFNPYALGNSSAIYTQISKVVSDMFGFCVRYFKTSADQRSKDIILHEYSLLNVIGEGDVKIVVPDNQLPTREINFNPLMMDYPTVFEVHIVKSAFRSVFGRDSKPEVGDYLYFEQYMNKMYEVNATSETDDYLYSGAYWRVSLAQYQKRSSVKFDSPEDEESVDTLIFNTEKFNIESLEQETDARKPGQYNTIGKVENDYVRRVLDKRLKIEMENIHNSWTVISKSHYALKSIPKGDPAVVYRYDKGWSSSDERMLTFWFRQKNRNALGGRIPVADGGLLRNENGMLAIKVDKRNTGIRKGDIIRLSGTNYPKLIKVTDIDDDCENGATIYTDIRFKDDFCTITPTVTPVSTNTFLSSEGGFEVSQIYNGICVSFNGKSIILDYKSDGSDPAFIPGEWYGVVLMVSASDGKCGLWVYSLSGGDPNMRNMDSEITRMSYCMKETGADLSCADGRWSLLACDMDITNIRLWNRLCEESMHNLILSQYVVKDIHLCEFVDNAQPELLLDKVTNPR